MSKHLRPRVRSQEPSKIDLTDVLPCNFTAGRGTETVPHRRPRAPTFEDPYGRLFRGVSRSVCTRGRIWASSSTSWVIRSRHDARLLIALP